MQTVKKVNKNGVIDDEKEQVSTAVALPLRQQKGSGNYISTVLHIIE